MEDSATVTSSSPHQPPVSLDEAIASLDDDQLIGVVRAAADRHEDVERLVRLVAARAGGDVSALRDAIDDGLRTRRFLDYRGSVAWAQDAHPVVGTSTRSSRPAADR
jgi:hypothetical protein